MCSAFERKENDFWELKNLIYTHDAAIKNSQVHHWSLKINIYMIYFLETLFRINLCPAKNQFKLQTFGCLALIMSFLQVCFGGYVKYIGGISKLQKYHQIWKKVKIEIWNRG